MDLFQFNLQVYTPIKHILSFDIDKLVNTYRYIDYSLKVQVLSLIMGL